MLGNKPHRRDSYSSRFRRLAFANTSTIDGKFTETRLPSTVEWDKAAHEIGRRLLNIKPHNKFKPKSKIPLNKFGNTILTHDLITYSLGDEAASSITKAFELARSSYKEQFDDYTFNRTIRSPDAAIFTDLDQAYARFLFYALSLEREVIQLTRKVEVATADADWDVADNLDKERLAKIAELKNYRIFLKTLDPSIDEFVDFKEEQKMLRVLENRIGSKTYIAIILTHLGEIGLISLILYDAIRAGSVRFDDLKETFGDEKFAKRIYEFNRQLNYLEVNKTLVIPTALERETEDLADFFKRVFFSDDSAAENEWFSRLRHSIVENANRDDDGIALFTEVAFGCPHFRIQAALAPQKEFERAQQKAQSQKEGILRVPDLRRISFLVNTRAEAEEVLQQVLESESFATLRVVDLDKDDNKPNHMSGYKGAYHLLVTPVTGEEYACNLIEVKIILHAYNDIQTFYGGHYTYEIAREYTMCCKKDKEKNVVAETLKDILVRTSREEFAIADFNTRYIDRNTHKYSKGPKEPLFTAFTPSVDRARQLQNVDPSAVILVTMFRAYAALKQKGYSVNDLRSLEFFDICKTKAAHLENSLGKIEVNSEKQVVNLIKGAAHTLRRHYRSNPDINDEIMKMMTQLDIITAPRAPTMAADKETKPQL